MIPALDDVRVRLQHEGGPHERLLGFLLSLRRSGEEALRDRLSQMEKADKMYRAYRLPDKDDIKAAKKGEPMKIIYPVTYAQIQTGIAQLMAIFVKSPFFELEPRGPKLYKNSKLMELELQYQLEQAGFVLKLYQWLLDMFRYGFGKLNVGYVKKLGPPSRPDGPPVLLDEGVELLNENPKEVVFDPNYSVGEIQRAGFVFSREKVVYNDLRQDPNFFNIEDLPAYNPFGSPSFSRSVVKGGDTVILDTAYVKLVPRQYELSPSDQTEIWKFVVANESRVILAEPLPNRHGQYPTVIIEYSPDLFATTNDGLAQVIEGLQDHINWLLNSHMQAVKRTVNNVAIVDPDILELEDLESGKNFIRVKRGKGGLIDRAWKQISFVDVTASHNRDAEYFLTFIQRATSFSDNSMGLQLPTARTATEVAAIQRLGNLRVRLLANLVFEQGLKPLCFQMIANTQQFMTGERYLKVSSDAARHLGIEPLLLEDGLLKILPGDLSGAFSIRPLDPTSPVDKLLTAGVLKELLLGLAQMPHMVQFLGINPKALLHRILQLYGVQGLSDVLTDEPLEIPEVPAAKPRGLQVQVMPEEKVVQGLEKGDLIPFNGAPEDFVSSRIT